MPRAKMKSERGRQHRAKKPAPAPAPKPREPREVITASYRMQAMVLVVVRYRCLQCGAEHSAPSHPKIMLEERVAGRASVTRTTTLDWFSEQLRQCNDPNLRSAIKADMGLLPRRLVYTDVTVSTCDKCWKVTEVDGRTPAQLDRALNLVSVIGHEGNVETDLKAASAAEQRAREKRRQERERRPTTLSTFLVTSGLALDLQDLSVRHEEGDPQ